MGPSLYTPSVAGTPASDLNSTVMILGPEMVSTLTRPISLMLVALNSPSPSKIIEVHTAVTSVSYSNWIVKAIR